MKIMIYIIIMKMNYQIMDYKKLKLIGKIYFLKKSKTV